MSIRTGSCPNCGAPIEFRWSSSVQTVCEYCKSIIVRTDVDLKKVGTVADIPDNSSPIQLGTEGKYQKHAFVVAGRIIYDYDQGTWNEWHLVFNDGSSGWLSDAQLLYDISFLAKAREALPRSSEITIGRRYQFDGITYQVTTITIAHYRGVQGELPFQYWDKADVPFIDLRTADGKFATLDYSDDEPLLFTGEAVEFDQLWLTNLRSFEGWPQ